MKIGAVCKLACGTVIFHGYAYHRLFQVFNLIYGIITERRQVVKMRKVLIILTAVLSFSLIGIMVVSIISPPGNKAHLNASEIETSSIVTPGSIDFTYTPPELNGGQKEVGYEGKDQEVSPDFVPATEIDTDLDSITVFINKEYSLPKDYKPKDMVVPKVLFNLNYYDERMLMRPEAAKALEDLFNAAAQEGYTLYGVSAFRSYERQKKIFLNNIVKKGKTHTLLYSAVPGTSEHQTGLAIDISTKSLGYRLIDGFADTKEGTWVANNAHKFGYIIRYPKDKIDVTGYAYEPWHIRYVGKDLANYLYNNNLTLDEYFNYTPSAGFDFEAKYAELINYRPPVITKIPDEDDKALLDEEALLNGEVPLDENGNPIVSEDDELTEEENDKDKDKNKDKDKDKGKGEKTDDSDSSGKKGDKDKPSKDKGENGKGNTAEKPDQEKPKDDIEKEEDPSKENSENSDSENTGDSEDATEENSDELEELPEDELDPENDLENTSQN